MMIRTILSAAALAGLAVLPAAALAHEDEADQAEAAPPARPAPRPPIFNELLPNVAGQRLRVEYLTLGDVSIPPHVHSGSVYLYVLEGAALLQIEGEPERIIRAGEGFFEPANLRHTLSKSAVPGEPARLLSIMVVPDGGRLATFD